MPASSTADLRRGTPALALPFGVVAGVGLVTVLLPPWEGHWWAVALAVLDLVLVVVVFLASQRRAERSWLDPLAAYLLFPVHTRNRRSETRSIHPDASI